MERSNRDRQPRRSQELWSTAPPVLWARTGTGHRADTAQ